MAWDEKWFEPAEKRLADADGLHGMIYEMSRRQSTVSGFMLLLDLGVSPIEALLELLVLLHRDLA